MFKNQTNYGVSSVLGIILIVSVSVALVVLVTVVAFDIGDNNSEPVDGTVTADIDEDSSSLSIEVLRNDNIEDIRVRGAENPSIVSNKGDVGVENIDIKNGFTKVDILAVVDGKKQILKTIDLPQEVIQRVNLLGISSFESNSNLGPWDFSDTSGSGLSNSFAFEGEKSIAMKDLTGSYGSRLMTSSPVSVSAGDKYNVSTRYYLPSSKSDFSGTDPSDYRYKLELGWLDGSGNEIAETNTFSDLSAFDSWEKVTTSGTAPNNAAKVEVRIGAKEDFDNDGNIYWDEISISRQAK